jgi:hypothetical protein
VDPRQAAACAAHFVPHIFYEFDREFRFFVIAYSSRESAVDPRLTGIRAPRLIGAAKRFVVECFTR